MAKQEDNEKEKEDAEEGGAFSTLYVPFSTEYAAILLDQNINKEFHLKWD